MLSLAAAGGAVIATTDRGTVHAFVSRKAVRAADPRVGAVAEGGGSRSRPGRSPKGSSPTQSRAVDALLEAGAPTQGFAVVVMPENLEPVNALLERTELRNI